MTTRKTFLAETMIEAAELGDLSTVQDMVARAKDDMVGKGAFTDLPHPNPQMCFMDGYKAGLNKHRADISAVFLDQLTEPKYIKQALGYAVAAGLTDHVTLFYGRYPDIDWQHEFRQLAYYGRVHSARWLTEQDPSLLNDLLSPAKQALQTGKSDMIAWLMQQAKPEDASALHKDILATEMKRKIKHETMAELLYDYEIMKSLVDGDPQQIVQPILREYFVRDLEREEISQATQHLGGAGRPNKM